MFGSHLSISGGLENALEKANELSLDCIQIFNANQRQWKAKPLSESDINKWNKSRLKLSWNKECFNRIVCHNSYLVNMASPAEESRTKSIARQVLELERCEQLGIGFLVSHPGAHLGNSYKNQHDLTRNPNKDESEGIFRIAKSIDQIHNDLRGIKSKICLETTVGSGTNLGYAFHHLKRIKENIKEPERIGFCFDTCHVTAAGYNLSTKTNAEKTLELWDNSCGKENINVFHFNDSVGKIGSRKDRHAHIGDGECGLACFKTIINDPKFKKIPKILETPKEEDGHGTDYDSININRLKKLIQK